ncbi:MAG TPA: hypothetical protein VIZ31_11735 [Vicinamibacteria bacterium]
MHRRASCFRVVIAIGCVAAGVAARAQITSPPPICFAFNDTGTSAPAALVTLDCTGAFDAHFVAPTTAGVVAIELWRPAGMWSSTRVEIFATVSLGAPATGVPLAVYFGCTTAQYTGPPWAQVFTGWNLCGMLGPPPYMFTFAAGSSYAARITPGTCEPQTFGACSPGACGSFGYDPAGTQMLPYQYASGVCSPSIAPFGQIPLSIRFRGSACGPSPQASILYFGGLCGGSPPVPWSSLHFSGPPVLGQPFFVSVLGPPNETALLLWSAGVNMSGAPIVASSPCLHYLNVQSFTALAQLGAQPLASGITSPIPWPYGGPFIGGALTWGFTVPASPAFAGLLIGVQGVLVGPTGSIALAPGVTGQVTNPVQLTLGY